MVFGGLLLVKPSFSREKDGFSKDGCSKQSFSREKDGFEPKNHLFLEKTKKNQKNHLFQNYGFSREKDGFWRSCPGKTIFFSSVLAFFLERKMVFGGLVFSRKRWFLEERLLENHLFLEKKMVSNQKNHLFLEKTKKTIFWRPQPHSFGKDVFFFCFFWVFLFFGFFWFVGFC